MAGEALAGRTLWTRVMALFGLEDEEEDEGVPRLHGGAGARPDRRERRDFREPRDVREGRGDGEPREGRLLVSLPGGLRGNRAPAADPAPGRPDVTLFQPRSFDAVQEMVDRLRHRGPLIVQLDQADRETAQRILNFLSGALYALDGAMYLVGAGVYLFVPGGVRVNDLRGGSH